MKWLTRDQDPVNLGILVLGGLMILVTLIIPTVILVLAIIRNARKSGDSQQSLPPEA